MEGFINTEDISCNNDEKNINSNLKKEGELTNLVEDIFKSIYKASNEVTEQHINKTVVENIDKKITIIDNNKKKIEIPRLALYNNTQMCVNEVNIKLSSNITNIEDGKIGLNFSSVSNNPEDADLKLDIKLTKQPDNKYEERIKDSLLNLK